MSNDAKSRLIFRKINSPSLINCLSSLESRADLAGLTFDEAISHITRVISRQTSNTTFVSNINVSSAGSSYSGRGRGCGRGRGRDRGGRGRGRGTGRGNQKSTWIPKEAWEKMTSDQKYAAKNPGIILVQTVN